jgi:hypothetical protein
MSDRGPTFFGEVSHQGQVHQYDCAIFLEPDEDMGPYACNCSDREDADSYEDDTAYDLALKFGLK